VNCGAIPDTLIDSELFGHEKGAFTGALSQKRGRFERAHKGTIFLDEIGELPLQAQVRLLKVLQSKEIERVGGVKTIALDIRIIAATNRNLEEMVKLHQFREDLWFRLNVFPILISPLRERRSDIPALLQLLIL
jgi:transcriptional regulator with GAF, ATPase, and Fis domain